MQRLQRGWPPQTAPSANHRQSLCGRRGLVVQAAEGPKLLPLLATAAAIGATAVTVRHVLVQRQRPQQQGAPAPQRQQLRRELGGEALASQQVQGLGFGWPLQSKEAKKERQLLTTLQDIEQRQYREEQAALQHWDARLRLRTLTLGELRAMAQQYNIAGRSKMRKRELVAALEARLGFATQPPQPPAHQRHLH